MTARTTLIVSGFVVPVVSALAFMLLLSAPAGSATGPAYPDLGMAPLADFALDRPADGRVLLRFSATIVNVGQGPMELNAARSIASGPFTASQKLYGADGNVSVATPGVSLVYGGDGHNHWHINNLESYELKRLDNGVKVGTGAKGGFCFFDTTAYRTTLPGAPASSFYRTSNACAYNTPLATNVAMGISSDGATAMRRACRTSTSTSRASARASTGSRPPPTRPTGSRRPTSRTTRHGSTSR